MIHYRSFRNTDPPGLVDIWNDAFTGRGSYHLRNSTPLERCLFSKPFFDPHGLIVAEEDGTLLGFGHAGFGPNRTQTALSRQAGVICMLAVRLTERGRGIGLQLLRLCSDYLRDRGAGELFAGSMSPVNPFYFGLYGGSESAGFLASDPDAAPFLEYHGYKVCETRLIFQRRLEQQLTVVDVRFPAIRRKYDVRIVPRIPLGSWWQESVLGLLEPVEFRLEDKGTGSPVARAKLWEMEGFSWRWNQPSVGIMDFMVRDELRRQGLGKYLLMQIVRYLQEQFFGIVEIQTPQMNTPGVSLCQSLGFEQVDVGRMFRQSASMMDKL